MTIIQKRTLFPLLLGLLIAGEAFGQSLPPLPPMPQGQLLDVWPFDGTNYLSLRRSAPTSLTNIALVPTWAGNGLQVDSTNAAWITYRVVETNGMTNLSCSQGTVEMWFSPDWNSSDGLGNWGTILEAGNWNTNVSEAAGAWGLYISPDGSSIYFSAQTNDAITNYLNAPISWNAGEWHYIVLTYSATNSALYLEGQLVTNGPGVSIVPGQNVLSNGFSVGSDSATGLLQSRAVFNYVATYNYELDPNTIGEDYTDDAPNVSPLPSSGFGLGGFTMDSDGPPSPGGGGFGTNSGGGGYTFNSPHYGSNDFWVEPAGIDTNEMLTLLVHATTNTSSYAPVYELLWTESLTPPISWEVFETFLGATNTNVTVLTVPVFPNEPAAFFQAVNIGTNGDSSGIGIPDWWQKEYFGSVGIDPYGDPMGDGYDNLYKFEHGMSPNTYYTPAAPGVSSILNTNGSIIISWNAATNLPSNGAGSVTGYTVENIDPYTGTNYVDLTAGQLSYTNQFSSFDALSFYINFPPSYYYTASPTYALRVNYANGSSQWSSSFSPFDPTCTVNAAITRGPNGSLYLAASSIPSNVSAIRIVSAFSGMYYPLNWYGYSDIGCFADSQYLNLNITCPDTNWVAPYIDVPVSSISNGLYQIPPSQVPLFQVYQFVTLGVGTNGNFGSPRGSSALTDWGNWYVSLGDGPTTLNIPFLDGRTNIQQNINLFLRSADGESPFSLYLFRGATYDATLYQPTNYVWDGFSDVVVGDLGWPTYQQYVPIYQRNEFQPFEETTLFTNIVFNPLFFDSSGNFTNGITVGRYYGNELDLGDPTKMFDAYIYATNNQSSPLSPLPFAVLTQAVESWICAPPYSDTLQGNSDGSSTLPVGTKNLYGLPILSIKYFDTQSNWDTVDQGTGVYMAGNWDFFQYVSPPVLSTVGYYFARPQIDPVPGQSAFTTTNTTPSLFIAPFGQEFYLTAWAKQSVSNGYSGVFAYPQQYFDKAYMADANGDMTTSETGLLSEYGDFFPLQPGKLFVTTKPDAATGTVGTNVVNVIKLQLDVNHDGKMDTSFAGPDNTTSDRPFIFWVNSDADVPTEEFPTGTDIWDPQHPDYGKGNIPSQRDLEDWARLWIVGLPVLPTNYAATLSWNVISGNPAINLVVPVETNGGVLYLTDTNIASTQASGSTVFDPSYKFGSVTPSNTLPLPSYFLGGPTNCFLFEGAGIGKGELVLTISQNGTNVASTSQFIELHDVRDFYERAIINTNGAGPALTNVSCSLVNVEQQTVSLGNEDTNIIVYAHGADNTVESWLMCSDTIFKRLYWSGYRGRFASVRWPSPPLASLNTDFSWFNKTEFFGYKSGPALKDYAVALQSRFPTYNIHMWVHSAGGPIGTEALSEGAPFKTLILSSTTLPASCYDVNAPTNANLLAQDGSHPTPEWAPWGYRGAYTNLSANVVNYYNTNDDLLTNAWATKNQYYFKPSPYYLYDGTNSYFWLTYRGVTLSQYEVADPLESRAMVSRSRTAAIGAQGPLPGQTRQGSISSTVDVSARFGLGSSDPEHGGFYMRAIQGILPYYYQVMTDCKIQRVQQQ